MNGWWWWEWLSNRGGAQAAAAAVIERWWGYLSIDNDSARAHQNQEGNAWYECVGMLMRLCVRARAGGRRRKSRSHPEFHLSERCGWARTTPSTAQRSNTGRGGDDEKCAARQLGRRGRRDVPTLSRRACGWRVDGRFAGGDGDVRSRVGGMRVRKQRLGPFLPWGSTQQRRGNNKAAAAQRARMQRGGEVEGDRGNWRAMGGPFCAGGAIERGWAVNGRRRGARWRAILFRLHARAAPNTTHGWRPCRPARSRWTLPQARAHTSQPCRPRRINLPSPAALRGTASRSR